MALKKEEEGDKKMIDLYSMSFCSKVPLVPSNVAAINKLDMHVYPKRYHRKRSNVVIFDSPEPYQPAPHPTPSGDTISVYVGYSITTAARKATTVKRHETKQNNEIKHICYACRGWNQQCYYLQKDDEKWG